jgi:hypothetical protein
LASDRMLSRDPAPGVPPRGDADQWHRALAARLRLVAAGRTLREIAALTGSNWETARRYLHHGRASAYFLVRFAAAFAVPLEWLLTGRPPPEPPRTDATGTPPRTSPGST